MSAFILSKAHIDRLVATALYGPSDVAQWRLRDLDWDRPPEEVGQILIDENVASVNYLYSLDDESEPYVWTPLTPRLTIVGALKALDCYEYQSCEHPAWSSSLARSLCASLRSALISALPGYDVAPWAYTDDDE